ncbi:MAG: UDP-N-acetylglucosamine pyrophosphorylase [Ruminococcaceae bacterium]|nr:UDP-N-acetylglucosamine pyrophosphorylase [Oscillospiraceae bacterium]
MIPKTAELFDLSHTLAAPLLLECEYPWEALPKIKDFILSLAKTLSEDDYYKVCEDVWIAKSAKIAPSALICGPTIIGENTEVRHCAYIRGNALIGDGAVIGNSTEVKNAIIFDGVQIPHYNYVGDSILGYKSHMGAGAIASNVRSDKQNISVYTQSERIATGLRKFGTILGDFVEVGCNSVLCPGSVVGRNSQIYPLTRVRGVIPESSVCKAPDNIVKKK